MIFKKEKIFEVRLKYKILRSQNVAELESLVDGAIRDGYKVSGGVQVILPTFDSQSTNISQNVAEFIQAVHRGE